MILVIGWHTPSDVIRRPAGVCCGSCLFVVVLFVSSLVFVSTFPLARIFAPSNLNPPPPPFPHPPPLPPPPPSPLHHPRRAFHLSFQPLFTDMIRFQLKPRFTQNPCFVSPLRVFPLRLSLQCAGFDSAHASRNMRMFFFVPISILVLAIGLLCHSYTFYVPIPHTGGLSIHLLVCRTPFTRATFLCVAFSKNLGSHTASV